MSSSTKSWLEIPLSSDFSLSNIPFGVFSPSSNRPRCGTAVGNYAVDLELLAQAGLFDDGSFHQARSVFSKPTLNAFMEHPRPVWVAVRNRIQQLFDSNNQQLQSNKALRKAALHPLDQVTMYLPATIGDYTDFYSSRAHATNVGTMFRGKDNALQPNWLHLPVGYHGRSSTIVVDSTPIRRPHGQLQKQKTDPKQGSTYGPCAKLDFELEVGFFVGGGEPPDAATGTSGPLSMDQAYQRIFGFCLLNDWSARDVQKWEYVPLGPFTSKNFATTISPWIVTTMALEPHCATDKAAQEEPTPLPYLQDAQRLSSFDVTLEVSLQSDTMKSPAIICRSNLKHLYWTAAQQLVHHTVTGCTMRAGDLLGSGTISGDTPDSYGSMLELSWNWTKDMVLHGSEEVRRSLQDGDTVSLHGWAGRDGSARVGFGSCAGKVLPAASDNEAVDTNPPTKERYTDFKLHGFWASSATWRVRIGLEAFSIPYETIAVNLREKNQEEEDYVVNVNPMGQVPVLEFKDDGKTVCLSQSVAILEFLEEAFPDKAPLLLPLDPVNRAVARQMVQLVTSGIQPLQMVTYLGDLEERSNGAIKAQDEGARRIQKGLEALKQMLRQYNSDDPSPNYCMGGFHPTMVDAVLVPQLRNARSTFHMNVDELFPMFAKIESTCLQHSWFSKSHPNLQPGAPPPS